MLMGNNVTVIMAPILAGAPTVACVCKGFRTGAHGDQLKVAVIGTDTHFDY